MSKLSKRLTNKRQRMDPKMKEKIRLLVDGQLPEDQVKDLIRMPAKDPDRFWTYLQVLQERVVWDDTILLRISEHLYIVRKEEGGKGDKIISRVVKCDCGHEFGDYRINWKFHSMLAVRKTTPELEEVYNAGIMPNPWVPRNRVLKVGQSFRRNCYGQANQRSPWAVNSVIDRPADPGQGSLLGINHVLDSRGGSEHRGVVVQHRNCLILVA